MKRGNVKIIPLILLAILLTVVVFVGSVVYVGNILAYTSETDMMNHGSISEMYIDTIKDLVKKQYNMLDAYSAFFSKGDFITKEEVTNLLRLIKESESYEYVAIVEETGIGMDSTGNEVNMANEEYFKNAVAGEKNVVILSTGEGGRSGAFFATPVINERGKNSVLICRTKPLILMTNDSHSLSQYNVEISIFNTDGSLVTSSNPDFNGMTLDETLAQGISYEQFSQTISEGIKKSAKLAGEEGELDELLPVASEATKKIYGIERGISLLLSQGCNDQRYVWYTQDISEFGWTVAIGRHDMISEETRYILAMTFTMVISMMLVMLGLFILLLSLQGMANRRLRKLAFSDSITGGMNWLMFQQEAKKLLRRRYTNYSMIVMDVNKFKVINDLYGHARGDTVLKELHRLLKLNCTRNELCARYMGDQFVLLWQHTSNQQLHDRIINLNSLIKNVSGVMNLQYAFGVFVISDKRLEISRIRDFASIAQDVVKQHTDYIVAFFDDRERTRILREQEIENTMEEALANNEFKVYLQPKYSADGKTVRGAEALVRWVSPSKGFIAPGEFIPTFERNGFVIELDKYMLDGVCEQQRRWLDSGIKCVPISVNVSRAHLSDKNIVRDILDIVDKHNVPHSLIELELTESAFFDNKAIILETINALQREGFAVSMDDFGSGYSSLNSLKDLPLDIVKLDGEFFRGEQADEQRQYTVIKDTISMAKNLQMKIVAEGIETKEQAEYLQSIGCDMIQGYYFARPMPVEQFEKEHLIKA